MENRYHFWSENEAMVMVIVLIYECAAVKCRIKRRQPVYNEV